MFDKLLYLPLDIENPPLTCLDKLNGLPSYIGSEEYSSLIRDNYRNCFHVPMMTKTDIGFEWTDTSKEFSDLVEWAEDVIFPWTGRSRIMIITTPSDDENPPHIDCSPKMFKTLQHKFRYVLQGNIDDLVFMSKEDDIYLDKTIDKPFIMSGKWPHYMKNNSSNTKFTFAFGAPWDGNLEDDKYKNMLSKSYDRYSEYYKSFDELSLPENYQDYYEEKYK